MAATLTANEEAQLLQTIEMFEVITQSQPMDYQSLEILKEAYSKLGRDQDVVGTSKRIAEAYVQLGQLSSAILEYESILQRFPDDPDVQKALSEIENKATSFSAPEANEADFVEKASASAALKKAAGGQSAIPTDVDDGKIAMQKAFVDSKLVSASDFSSLWTTPNLRDTPKQPTEPFIQLLADKAILPLDKSLKMLCDKSRMGYLPIEKYDVDVDLARTFPKEVCLRWCILPFDKMSKSLMVATSNPFNKQALYDIEPYTKGRVLWYVSSPPDLMKILKKIYR
jgi:hypothetical protein